MFYCQGGIMTSTKYQLVQLLLLVLFIEANSQENLRKSRSFLCIADLSEPWGYRLLKAPPFWGLKYRTCYGRNQSPIDIRTDNVEADENLSPLVFENYDKPVPQSAITNNGHTIEVAPGGDIERVINVGQETTATLRQIHFHWGSEYNEGSEHSVDGEFYAMEIHLVHTTSKGRIIVLASLMKEGDENNEELQKIVDQLGDVRYKDNVAQLDQELNLSNLLPSNRNSYYRYNGSLTTPPCSEGVTWSVLTEPIPVGRDQMEEFRKLYSSTEQNASPACKLAGNFRPVQPLNGRTVKLAG